MHGGDDIPLVSETTSMNDVLIAMAAGGPGFAGVVGIVNRKGGLAGIITDGDLRRHMERGLLDRTARDVMSAQSQDRAAGHACRRSAGTIMNDKKITRSFVLDPADKSKKPDGIMYIYDCLRAGL